MGLYSIRDFDRGGMLSEAYVPKSKELKKAEALLDQLRTPYLTKDSSGLTGVVRTTASRFKSIGGNIQNDPKWVQFEHCLEKQFGFRTFTVNIVRNSLPNAFTLPVSLDITHFGSFDDVLDKNGLRYRESANIDAISFITDGLLFNGKLSSGQVMAVIIHEIGHNFTQTAIDFIAKFKAGQTLLAGTIGLLSLFTKLDRTLLHTDLPLSQKLLMTSMLFLNDTTKNKFNTLRRDEDTNGLKQILDFGYSVSKVVDDFNFIKDELDRLKYMFLNIFRNQVFSIIKSNLRYSVATMRNSKKQIIMSKVMSFPGFMDESFADKFVAMNGYGVEFTTGMRIFESEIHGVGIYGTVDNIPIVGQLFAVKSMINSVFSNIMGADPHPSMASRLQTQIDVLETELNRPGVSERTKALIRKDLANIEKENKKLDVLLSKEINLKSSHYRYYIMTFNKWLSIIQPKNDIRELFMSVVKDNDSIMQSLEDNARRAEEKFAEKINSIGRLIKNK
jgi:hypothetical protein